MSGQKETPKIDVVQTPTIYSTPDTFAWVAKGTSEIAGVYRVLIASSVIGRMSLSLHDDGRAVTPENNPPELKDGDLIVCTENRLDDQGRIWFGRCEYVIVDGSEDGILLPRMNGVFRTYNPLEWAEQNDSPVVEQIDTLTAKQFEIVQASIDLARQKASNGLGLHAAALIMLAKKKLDTLKAEI